MQNTELKYRTYDQLMSDVRVDLQSIALENFINPQQFIKVARRVNHDLGLRIYKTKEALLEVRKGRVKLPDDFYVINFGMICGGESHFVAFPQGTHIEEVPVYREQPAFISSCTNGTICASCAKKSCGCSDPCPSCSPCSCTTQSASVLQATCSSLQFDPLVPFGDVCTKPRVFMNCKNECFELVQIVKGQVMFNRHLRPLRIIENAEGIECGCPGLYMRCSDEAWIKDGFLYTNFDCADVYINYEGMLQDDGTLLVPDHELLNEYYEYAVKERIFENMYFDGEDTVNKLQLTQQKLRLARIEAISLVNTPNFAELKKVFEMNRKAQYSKYYSMFRSYPYFNYVN